MSFEQIEETEQQWPDSLRMHLRETISLATPIVLSRMAVMAMFVTDTVMVARHSGQELAYLSIGLAPTSPIVVGAVGLLMGTMVVTANAFGAGKFEDCGRALRRSLPYAFGLSLIAAFFTLFGEQMLRLSGQSEDLAVNGGRIMMLLGLGMPAHFVGLACINFLEGVKRPVPGMVMMIFANVINVGINWLLIFGHFGFPEMGAAGAVIGTVSARYGITIAALVFIWNMSGHNRFGVRNRPGGHFSDWKKQRRIGYAAGASGAVEASAFSAMTLFAGWFGAAAVAAYSIGNSFLGVSYMFAIGLGSATAVRVGIAYGAGKPHEIAMAGWTGLGLNVTSTIIIAMVLLSAPATMAALYTSDPELLEIVVGFMILLTGVVILDGAQGVMGQALRGMGETIVPTAMHIVAYVLVMIPVAWVLAIQMEMGVNGLFWAMILASAVSLTLLGWRFHSLASRQ